MVKQADENLAVSKNFKIRQLQFKSTLRLFEWIYGANSFFVPIYIYHFDTLDQRKSVLHKSHITHLSV